MPITVELQDEAGSVITRTGESTGAVSTYLPDFEREQFSIIRYIDPYGRTIFNRLQMATLIADLRLLRSHASTDAERRLVDEIIALAEICAADPHHYLVFIGD